MAVSATRKIKESPIYIGANETIPKTLNFADFVPSGVTALTSPVVTLYDITDGEPGTDVSSTNLSGSPTFASLVMTLPLITALTKDHIYLLRARGSGGGGTYEAWGEVRGEF